MKALTICQPYSFLICLPDDDDRAKRVENRTWPTGHRGLLAIHAGKGRNYLDEAEDYGIDPKGLVFGAIEGVANLAGCVQLDRTSFKVQGVEVNGQSLPGTYVESLTLPSWALRHWPWLAGHRHVEGPVCWVLTEVRRLPEPVPCRGAQNLWNVPADVEAKVRGQLP